MSARTLIRPVASLCQHQLASVPTFAVSPLNWRRPYSTSEKTATPSPLSKAQDVAIAGQQAHLPGELMRIFVSHIKTHGPLPLSRYISLCLSHPTLGYYTRAQRYSPDHDTIIGKTGDFVTSPEISQVFGELLAIWYISQWQAQGMPDKIRIVELGPGRGTLMDDLLRTLSSVRSMSGKVSDVHLVETSPYMRQMQKAKLGQYPSVRVHWHDRIQDVPQAADDTFTILVAHEFFDALPIHRFEKRPEGWREVFVDIDVQQTSSKIIIDPRQPTPSRDTGTKLRYVLSKAETVASRLLLRKDQPELDKLSGGARVEISSEAYEIAIHAARLLNKRGAGLIIDYGGEQTYSNSFRAFKQHQIVDPLEQPGSADLTSNVNFQFLRDALTAPSLDMIDLDQLRRDQSDKLLDQSHAPAPKAAVLNEAAAVSHTSSPNAAFDQSAVEQARAIFVPKLQSQRSFLLSMGLQTRVQKLLDACRTEERARDIIKAAERLVDKNEKASGMGKAFKVMAFVPAEPGAGDGQQVFPFGVELD